MKGQKLGLCLLSLIVLSPRRVSPILAWVDFHARSRFALGNIPEENGGLLVVYRISLTDLKVSVTNTLAIT